MRVIIFFTDFHLFLPISFYISTYRLFAPETLERYKELVKSLRWVAVNQDIFKTFVIVALFSGEASLADR